MSPLLLLVSCILYTAWSNPLWFDDSYRDAVREQERVKLFESRHELLPFKATLFHYLWRLHQMNLPMPSDISECRENCVVLLWHGPSFYLSFPKELTRIEDFAYPGYFDPRVTCGVFTYDKIGESVKRSNFTMDKYYCLDELDNIIHGRGGRIKAVRGGSGCAQPWCKHKFE